MKCRRQTLTSWPVRVYASEINNLAEEMPELVATLKAGYKNYEKQNGVVPVPEDYDPRKQIIKNSARGDSH